MKQRSVSKLLAVVGIGLFCLGSAAPTWAGEDAESIAGGYVAKLDLGALGEPRIETLYIFFDANGGVVMNSEHEADKESAGIGVWAFARRGGIGWGAASFRYGPDADSSICGLVGVMSPPSSCVLKLGGSLRRPRRGSNRTERLVGSLFLTVETADGMGEPVVLPDAFPITLKKLKLRDFPGAPRAAN